MFGWILGLLFGGEEAKRKQTGRGLGVQPSPPDERDFVLSTAENEPLPASATLKGYSVKSQGSWNSCSGHAVASAAEVLQGVKVPLSERHNWYHTRKDYMKTFPRNTGVYLRDAIKVAQKIGLAPETLCPYDDDAMNDAPSVFAESFARFFKVDTYFRCWGDNAIKEAIANGYPVVIGMLVWREFLQLNQYDVEVPSSFSLRGGHAMLAVGYDEVGLHLLNSWNVFWGRRGSCRLPWSIVRNQRIFFEAWAITDIVRE